MPPLPKVVKSNFIPLLSTLVLFLSVFVGVTLVQQEQELRERAQSSIPAFPGAEGFGAQSIGGRGGKVFEVTNLNNSGSGSLRACVEASGPRTCVFRTGGTIELSSKLIINNPYITIAGQTAPGGGIALKRSAGTSGAFFNVGRGAHDVVIRYIRIRPGTFGGQPDGIGIYGNNVIVDHSSVSWAVDENMSTWYNAQNITIQWSIISEGLYCSTHPKGCHSMGLLLGASGSGNISVHHNLFAHNDERNPRIKTSGTVDVVNNIIYNPGISGSWGPSHISGDYSQTPINYVANFYKTGPDSDQPNYYISAGSGPVKIYVKGKYHPKTLQ